MLRWFFPYGGRASASPISSALALEAQQLTVRYLGIDQPALRDVTVNVSVGTRIALVGPNGAGKSTLLKAAAGLLPIADGCLKTFGLLPGRCAHLVSYLAQRGEVDWQFPISVRRLVVTGRYPHLGWLRPPSREDWRRADAALDRLGIRDLAERQIGELSGGQQQRALLARALAQEAALLLLDEPLNAVDAATREVVSNLLRDLGREGKTVIVATHDLDRLQTDFDDALFLVDGQVVARNSGQAHPHYACAAQLNGQTEVTG